MSGESITHKVIYKWVLKAASKLEKTSGSGKKRRRAMDFIIAANQELVNAGVQKARHKLRAAQEVLDTDEKHTGVGKSHAEKGAKQVKKLCEAAAKIIDSELLDE